MANCGGSTTRALSVCGATGVRGRASGTCAAGGGVADRGGVAGVAGTGGCTGLVGVTGACAPDETPATSGLVAATIFSADLFAAGAIGSAGVDARTGTSTFRGRTGGAVGSARGASIGRVTGLAVGQLLTPPAWTVLHHEQRTGWVLTLGGEVLRSARAGLGADLKTGVGRLGGPGSRGFGASAETAE